jgi:hypothetical protein
MTCPKCKSEQPDSAKFCSECATPLTGSGQTVVVKSKIPTWLAVVLVLALAFIGIAVWNMMRDNERLRANQRRTPPIVTYQTPQPQPRSVNLTNGAATVAATAYTWYKFVVPQNVSAVEVSGHFAATGGTGNDIDCYIIDEDGFANFKNGHPSQTYYNSGRVTQAKIETRNLSPGTYYIMLDNRFSLFTPKAVQLEVTLRYLQ